jgi:serine/threonine protein kinase
MPDGFCHICFADLASGADCPRCGQGGVSSDDQIDVLVPGSILGGKFTIGRLLGRGGFGATYLAWDMNLQVRVAIKEFLPRQLAARVPGETRVYPYGGDTSAFQAGLDQFLGEAQNLAQFRDHPGIISVLDFFPENGTGYMVMEYLDGETLEDHISRVGRLDTAVALELVLPVADALRACHAVGLIHRDISPDNIFITSDSRVKLLDFGAARYAIGARSTNLSVILKEGYAPFEQYQRNGQQGAWTDVYALTATLYRLLTGQLPPSAADRIGGATVPTLSEKGVVGPPSLQELLDTGMAVQPQQRYQTVKAFLDGLQAVVAVPGSSAGRQPANARARPSNVWRRRWGAIGGLACAIAIAAGVAVTTSDRFREHPLAASTNDVAPVAFLPELPKPNTSEVLVASRPIQTHPGMPGSNPIESARGIVRQAAQNQIQVGLDLAQRRGALKSLERLKALTVKTDVMNRTIGTEQNLYDSANGNLRGDLDKYLSGIELLAARDPISVSAAIDLERGAISTVTVDKGDAETKTVISAAIGLVAKHVLAYQGGTLTPDIVTADVEQASSQGKRRAQDN